MRISIAMATYNGAAFLREQLDSIIAQSRLPDELIVCDDQSTDETVQILRDYAGRSPFPIRVEINEKRLGSTKNFEKAIGLCSGDIIALSDQDDVWMPHKLETIEGRFEREADLGLLFSNGFLIDERGNRLQGDMWSRFKFSERLQRLFVDCRVYDLLLSWSFITGATIAFRSQFQSLILPVPDGVRTFIHDRWIAILIAAVARVDFIEDKLISYRLHAQQQLGVGKEWIIVRYTTPYLASSDAEALTRISGRLHESQEWPPHPEFVEALLARQAHVEAREGFSRNPIRRVSKVFSEYLAGGYTRYPLGFRQALKDAAVGTR